MRLLTQVYVFINVIVFALPIPDIDECMLDNGNCSHLCVNDIPYYHCDCPFGGQLDPSNRTCVFNANCAVSDGQVTCQCLPGYRNVSSDRILNCTGERVARMSIIMLS